MNSEELVRKMMESIINEEWEPIDMVVATTILNKAAYDYLKFKSPNIFKIVKDVKNIKRTNT